MFGRVAVDPIQQFEIHPIVPINIGGVDLSFTNSSLWMLIGVAIVVVFFAVATGKRALIPGRTQSVAEILHDFIANLARDTIGHDWGKFFPYVFTLFIFIFVANFLGLLPSIPGSPHSAHVFTTTSHLVVTFALAMLTITMVIAYGLAKHGLKFFKLFAPSGVPLWLLPLLVLIEFVSFLSRPFSLAIRLFANMFAGHIILKLFAGFVGMMLAGGGVVAAMSVFPFLGTIAVTALELLIAALQAYVFAVLTCIYLSDAAHAADH
jgi:F-type H+-transporting ATPase subunit a